ncbi:MAG: lysophospholipid acyltransferase family protein [Deltaproteobacteria bacterium]|nr:lysophospholipid acyltransferase family protein [Deltaproteobacteria bacterium]
MTPHIPPDSPDFPGDPSPQPPFGAPDALRSIALWSLGLPHLAAWVLGVRAASGIVDLKRHDRWLKLMARSVTTLAGIRVETLGREVLEKDRAYVYVVNHVNIFDMFVIYQSIPSYTRSLEEKSHFSWPIIGSLITAAGQIPVDRKDRRVTARGLMRAAEMLRRGESLTVLPEGARTLDGGVGPFYEGAFRLAIQAGAPVAPFAMRGGRAISRRGDFRIRPGSVQVLFAAPVPTAGMKPTDAGELARRCRTIVIELLQGRRRPGE